MQKVKWGILGTAGIAKSCTVPGMKQADNCDLYAIAGRSLEKAEVFKTEFGFRKAYGNYEELINDEEVQAIYIPLPNHLHFPWVKAALEKKKHVLCEKPLGMNAGEVKEMFRLADENGVFLMEAAAYLHSPYMECLKADIRSGIIGDVDYVESAFIGQELHDNFREHKEFGGGAVYDLGCYCTTMFLSLIDAKPDDVKAFAEFTDLDVDSFTSGMIHFENGTRADFSVRNAEFMDMILQATGW